MKPYLLLVGLALVANFGFDSPIGWSPFWKLLWNLMPVGVWLTLMFGVYYLAKMVSALKEEQTECRRLLKKFLKEEDEVQPGA